MNDIEANVKQPAPVGSTGLVGRWRVTLDGRDDVSEESAKIVVTTSYETEECDACGGWGVIPCAGRVKAVTCAICNGDGETRRPTVMLTHTDDNAQ